MLEELSRELEVEKYAVRFNAFNICPCHEEEYRDPKQREETLDPPQYHTSCHPDVTLLKKEGDAPETRLYQKTHCSYRSDLHEG